MKTAGPSLGLILWHPYSAAASVALSLILFAIGAAALFVASRLSRSIKLPVPGKGLKVAIVVVWALSILVALRLFRDVAVSTGQSIGNIGPVFPITLDAAVVSFLAIAYVSRRDGASAALGRAFAGSAAGPMVFELPFVLIITPVVTTAVHSGALLFSVFLVVILSTLALPLFSSRFAVTRYSLYFLGAMFFVFGAWALLTGYSPPSGPLSFWLNALSKVLGFAAVAVPFAEGGKPAVARAAPGQAL